MSPSLLSAASDSLKCVARVTDSTQLLAHRELSIVLCGSDVIYRGWLLFFGSR